MAAVWKLSSDGAAAHNICHNNHILLYHNVQTMGITVTVSEIVDLLISSVPQPGDREVSQSWAINTSMTPSSLQSSWLYPLQYFLHLPKKEHTQTHRAQQGIPSCLSCIRCKWKLRCQISCQQPRSTPIMFFVDTWYTFCGKLIDLDKSDHKNNMIKMSTCTWLWNFDAFACGFFHAYMTKLSAIYLVWQAGVSVDLRWNRYRCEEQT